MSNDTAPRTPEPTSFVRATPMFSKRISQTESAGFQKESADSVKDLTDALPSSSSLLSSLDGRRANKICDTKEQIKNSPEPSSRLPRPSQLTLDLVPPGLPAHIGGSCKTHSSPQQTRLGGTAQPSCASGGMDEWPWQAMARFPWVRQS